MAQWGRASRETGGQAWSRKSVSSIRKAAGWRVVSPRALECKYGVRYGQLRRTRACPAQLWDHNAGVRLRRQLPAVPTLNPAPGLLASMARSTRLPPARHSCIQHIQCQPQTRTSVPLPHARFPSTPLRLVPEAPACCLCHQPAMLTHALTSRWCGRARGTVACTSLLCRLW